MWVPCPAANLERLHSSNDGCPGTIPAPVSKIHLCILTPYWKRRIIIHIGDIYCNYILGYIGSTLRVLFKSRLHKFWQKHPDARGALQAWLSEVERAQWQMPGQVTERYPTASAVPGNRIVFRIRGNRYRMVVEIDYQRKDLYILFLGTHAEYNRIDATEV